MSFYHWCLNRRGSFYLVLIAAATLVSLTRCAPSVSATEVPPNELGQWHDPVNDQDLPERSDPEPSAPPEATTRGREARVGREPMVQSSPEPRLPSSFGIMTYQWNLQAQTPDRLFVLTPEEVLWMGRMLFGEANGYGRNHYSLILFTAFQRHAYLPGAPRSQWSLIEFMRAFSQPINPRFNDPATPQCRRRPHSCTASKIARRVRIQEMSWEELPVEIRETVLDFAQGKIDSPAPQSIDFAAAYGPDVDCRIPGQRVSFYDPPGRKYQAVFCESTVRPASVVSVIEAGR